MFYVSITDCLSLLLKQLRCVFPGWIQLLVISDNSDINDCMNKHQNLFHCFMIVKVQTDWIITGTDGFRTSAPRAGSQSAWELPCSKIYSWIRSLQEHIFLTRREQLGCLPSERCIDLVVWLLKSEYRPLSVLWTSVSSHSPTSCTCIGDD